MKSYQAPNINESPLYADVRAIDDDDVEDPEPPPPSAPPMSPEEEAFSFASTPDDATARQASHERYKDGIVVKVFDQLSIHLSNILITSKLIFQNLKTELEFGRVKSTCIMQPLILRYKEMISAAPPTTPPTAGGGGIRIPIYRDFSVPPLVGLTEGLTAPRVRIHFYLE